MPKRTVAVAASGLPKKQIDTTAYLDTRLIWLGQCLIDVDAQRDLCDADDEKLQSYFYNENWKLREEINDMTARTLADYR